MRPHEWKSVWLALPNVLAIHLLQPESGAKKVRKPHKSGATNFHRATKALDFGRHFILII